MLNRSMRECVQINKLGKVLVRHPRERIATWHCPKTVEVRGGGISVRTTDGYDICFFGRSDTEVCLLWTKLRDSKKYDVPADWYQDNWTARLRS